MDDPIIDCGGCGETMPPGATICPHCGWDLSAVLSAPPRPSLWQKLASGGWRVVVYGLLLLVPILGFMRLHTTGPGPDLATTIRWMALGDGGRAAELETIHRMHEISSAASRYGVREMEIPPFSGDWEKVLAPASTARVRGWIPLVFYGADTSMAPASVRDMYEVRAEDGWGREYRINATPLPRGEDAGNFPIVAADLEAGLQATFFTMDEPDLSHGDWMRLFTESAGPDEEFGTDDDITMVSYVQVGHVFRLLYDTEENTRRVERAYTIGRHYYRLEGNTWDLIDARLLAEYRLTSIH